jgi:disulfide bond formation protein DsbB
MGPAQALQFVQPVLSLLTSAGAVVAALALLRRRPWSITVFVVLRALAILIGLYLAGLEIWLWTSAPGTQAAFPAAHFGRLGMTLLGAVTTLIVNLLVLRWLYRFRREFSPAPEPAAPASVEI